MKRFSEQFNKKSQTVTLKKAEQADLRARIVSYMEYHPLPADMKASSAQHKATVPSHAALEAFHTYQVPFASIFKYAGVFSVIVLLIIPFVAERAVPGDTLYAVKVNINEELRSTLTLDPYQKVEWETARLNRRIAEARLLADTGRLTEAAEADVAAAVKKHTDSAKAEIELLRATDADDAAIAQLSLDSTLTMQAYALAASVLSADEQATSSATTDLIAIAIGQSLEKPAGYATTTLPALPKLIARVEQGTTRLRELEASLGTQIDSITTVDVTRRIEDIERSAAEAFALPAEAEIQAQEILVDVLRRTQKLIVFMTELEVRESVKIETAVPVVLTAAEKDANRLRRMTQINAFLTQLQTTELEDDELTEKLVGIIDRIESISDELETIEDYTAYMSLSAEGIALGTDAELMLRQAQMQLDQPVIGMSATTTASTTQATSSSATTTDVTLPDQIDDVVGDSEVAEVITASTSTATSSQSQSSLDE